MKQPAAPPATRRAFHRPKPGGRDRAPQARAPRGCDAREGARGGRVGRLSGRLLRNPAAFARAGNHAAGPVRVPR